MGMVPTINMTPNGPVFSRIIQGYWRMSDWQWNSQQHLSFIKQHVELGITTVDHAHVYGNPAAETLFGGALKLDPSLREKIQVVSKCGINVGDGCSITHYDSSKNAILTSVETSLTRLGIEHLDLLLIHRPDYLMDIDEVACAFEELNASGKVRYFGVSNFTVAQFSLLQSRLNDPLVTNQVEINPMNMSALDNGTLDDLQRRRIIPMAWSCLAGGRVLSEQSEQAIRLRGTLISLTEELGAEFMDQVIYAWVMRLPCSPAIILGSGNVKRIRSAVNSLTLQMSREQWYRVWVAAKGHGVP